MGQRVIVHRYEESESGANRIVESGAFDPDADDNPDWVTEALANRPEPEAEKSRLAEWDEPLAVAQPAAVLDPLGFSEDTSVPEGADEEVVEDEPVVDPDPQPATVLDSVEFGVEASQPDAEVGEGATAPSAPLGDAGAGEAEDDGDKPEPKATPKKATAKPKATSTEE